MAAVEGDDTDIFALLRRASAGRRESVPSCAAATSSTGANFSGKISAISIQPEFFSSLLKQSYLDDPYIPAFIHVPVEFEDRAVLEEFLSPNGAAAKWRFTRRSAGQKRAMIELVESNAKHSFEQRFRVMKPSLEGDSRRRFRTRWAWSMPRTASNVSIFPTFRAPTKWPAWWCGKTGG